MSKCLPDTHVGVCVPTCVFQLVWRVSVVNGTIRAQSSAVSDEDFPIQSVLGVIAALFLRACSFHSLCATGQDWEADHLISQRDADDSLCNSICFHLASSGQAATRQSHVFPDCLHSYCPRKGQIKRL